MGSRPSVVRSFLMKNEFLPASHMSCSTYLTCADAIDLKMLGRGEGEEKKDEIESYGINLKISTDLIPSSFIVHVCKHRPFVCVGRLRL